VARSVGGMERQSRDGLLSGANAILLADLLEVSERSKRMSKEEYNDKVSPSSIPLILGSLEAGFNVIGHRRSHWVKPVWWSLERSVVRSGTNRRDRVTLKT
jgi:hypothetical protein